MQETWRWFGPKDAITLPQIRQAGARGIVTALHDIPYGVAWSEDAIRERQALIAANPALGLTWEVVESLPVHEDIKLATGRRPEYLETYKASLRALGRCGVRTVCYNFMPAIDWTRTTLAAKLPGGGTGLRFEASLIAAFDVCMLQRPGAEAEHGEDLVRRGRAWFAASPPAEHDRLLAAIMAGLPGAYDRYDVPGLRRVLARYAGIDRTALRANLADFLRAVVPTAEAAGIRLCIHPDDPPRPIFGLPRIASGGEDLDFVLSCAESPANGLTFCTGSLGAGPHNDVPALARRFADRTWFAHLRNVSKEPDGSFAEAEHLGGDVDMVAVITALLEAQSRRRDAGDPRWRIPLRPDHGHELLDDVGKPTHPGYPMIGRLKGLAELRGVMAALASVRGLPT